MPQILTDGTNSYLYGPAGQALEQVSTAGTVTFLHHDQLGTTRLLTSTAGAVTGTATYDAYGLLTASSGTLSPLGYNGQYTDSESGLIYLRACYFDPVTAQFITIDPLRATSSSYYGYAAGAPLDNADPLGLMCWSWHCVSHDVSVASDAVATVSSAVAVGCAAFGQPECVAVAEGVAEAASIVQTVADLNDALATGHLDAGALALDLTSVATGAIGKGLSNVSHAGRILAREADAVDTLNVGFDEFNTGLGVYGIQTAFSGGEDASGNISDSASRPITQC